VSLTAKTPTMPAACPVIETNERYREQIVFRPCNCVSPGAAVTPRRTRAGSAVPS
jgi:hypothetical protein